eukprot:2436332-Alexandrium_andersonii.AAC.1
MLVPRCPCLLRVVALVASGQDTDPRCRGGRARTLPPRAFVASLPRCSCLLLATRDVTRARLEAGHPRGR